MMHISEHRLNGQKWSYNPYDRQKLMMIFHDDKHNDNNGWYLVQCNKWKGRAFERWVGTDIYVPAMLRSSTFWQIKAMPGTSLLSDFNAKKANNQ